MLFLALICVSHCFFTIKNFQKVNADYAPGAKGAVTQGLFDYALQVYEPALKQFLTNFTYDYPGFIYQELDTPVGTFDINITNLKVSQVVFDDFTFKIDDNVFDIALKAGGGYASFNWWLKKDKEASGPGDATVNVDFSFELNLKDAPLWLKALLSVLKGEIQKQIVKYVEESGPAQIKEAVENFLNSWNFSVPIVDTVYLDVHVGDILIKGSEGLTGLAFVGEFKDDTVDPFPGKPSKLPDYAKGAQMIQGYLDEFIPNSAGWVFHKNGMLDYMVTQETIPEEIPITLNTSAFKDIIPELYSKYPAKILEVDMFTSAVPTVAMTKADGITFHIEYNGHVEVLNGKDFDADSAFVFGSVIDGGATVTLKGDLFQFSLDEKTIKNSLVKSDIGQFDFSKFDTWLTQIYSKNVFPYLNEIGTKGIVLPLEQYGVELKNFQLDINDNYGDALFDVKLTPIIP